MAIDAGFNARLVSDNEGSHIIQKTIVQNIYDDDIVICDVSSKNPNVMFELGMRFAFDKATIIIKDLETTYSFDTSPVEHLNYRKDLRYFDIEDFKSKLKLKLQATYQQSKLSNQSMYLDSFGKFEIKTLTTNTITDQEYIIKSFEELKSEVKSLQNNLVETKMRSSVNDSSVQYLDNRQVYELYQHYLQIYGIDNTADHFINWLSSQGTARGFLLPPHPVILDILERYKPV